MANYKDIKYDFSGASLTALNATQLTSGTTPDARYGTLPAVSGVNLTALNATNLGSGTVPTARLGTGTASSSTFLRGDGAWNTAGGVFGTNAFMAREDGDVTITSNTHTLCPNNGVVYDPDSCYDSSAGEYHFTAPATGYYFFFQENKVHHSDGKGQMVIWPKKNGSDSGAIQYGSTVTFAPSGGGEKDALVAWTLNSHWIMPLSANDEISFWVYVYSWDAEDGTINYYSNFAGGWRIA
jgi:hypothetical protein